jgi:N-acylneuraminate cytidylyltransferase
MKNKICSIILARGDSQGLKNKNIKKFCNKPLIEWTILACKQSGIKDIYVSSDSKKILNISHKLGAKIITRPKKISGCKTSSEECWLHAIEFLKRNNLEYEIIVAPQVTSPIRNFNDIKKAISHLKKNNLDSLFSANQGSDTLFWQKKNKSLKPLNYDHKLRLMRQEMCTNIIENGSFYIFKSKKFVISKNRICGKFGFYLLKKWQQFEIDDYDDFIFCQYIMRNYIIN